MNNLQVPAVGTTLNPRSRHRKIQVVIEEPGTSNYLQYSFHWETFQILANAQRPCSWMMCEYLREIIEMYKHGLQLPFIIADRNLILRDDETIASKCWISDNYRFSAKMIK